ncbi:VanZ family protein [Pararhizobium mangrovi]|uniref:VanZ family protein n=1 Tax=Pararhizobium mangrovi TaxID=2590452 RepID=A0A506UGR6_9HYPH|nr:VanZ family protein [Pararhizobium mangrovi]TPW31327.1 VanZ family protein [Pararhizobium mangrovi]
MKKFVRLLAVVSVLVLVAATVSPISLRPSLGFGADVDRAFGFFVAGLVTALVTPRRSWSLVAAAFVAGAVGLELLQFVAIGRHPRLHDAAIKACAGVLGVGIATLVRPRQ